MSATMLPKTLAVKSFLSKISGVIPILHNSFRHALFVSGNSCTPCSKHFHTSRPASGLWDFFDHKDNWGKREVPVGRPYKKDELRIKGNEDLHKLWYVLLKEYNMLLTMEHEYVRRTEVLPSPERLEKVEESLDNLWEVVRERNEALLQLTTGEGYPDRRYLTKDVLGRPRWKQPREHHVPWFMSKMLHELKFTSGMWTRPFRRLEMEQKSRQRIKAERRQLGAEKKLAARFGQKKDFRMKGHG
ncbi:39S ribosomal protein L47, mitochondrial [Lingula anatina]|uniref:Large ribosomal subunit protein uL29m n=1 Tax=Lingula anatina TaxID=7574 RepID=A0A1S3JP52_LINAN|nr:39S ribosomal protein L47, mitochondrial [Lingula anatina]|eukprot:XP_013412145.1 39S ribosomal protein L47, mitochondrial [Lingula anatina]